MNAGLPPPRDAAGAVSVQVRTGEYAGQRGRSEPPEPAHVIDSIADLPAFPNRVALPRRP